MISTRYIKALDNEVAHGRIQSDMVRYSRTWSDTVGHGRIQSDMVGYSRTWSDTVGHGQIQSDEAIDGWTNLTWLRKIMTYSG